jgi:hypothetical protein
MDGLWKKEGKVQEQKRSRAAWSNHLWQNQLYGSEA